MQRMSSHRPAGCSKSGSSPAPRRPSPALRPPHPLLVVVAREGERRAVEAGPGHSPSPVSAGPYRVARSWQLAATVRLSGAGTLKSRPIPFLAGREGWDILKYR